MNTGSLTEALLVFVSSFGLASCAGLASLLRSERPLSPLKVASAMLNSGLLGLGLSLLWYERFRDNIYALVGATVLAGMGGAPFVELVLGLLRNTLMKFLGGVGIREALGPEDRTSPEKGGGER